VVAGKADADWLEASIMEASSGGLDPLALLSPGEAPYLGKYDEWIPQDLLRKAFSVDGLDVPGFHEMVKRWRMD
ncbi:hypothetical protein, partial [Paenibacillus durus]